MDDGAKKEDKWMMERRKRITASRVGSIAKMKKTTKRSKKVQTLIYNNFKGNNATRYGIAKEEETRQDLPTKEWLSRSERTDMWTLRLNHQPLACC